MQDPRHDPVSRTGLEGKEISSPSGRGRKMPLTFPLIDPALSLIDCQPSMSVIAIFRHLVATTGSLD
jgi:hypothetical protein